MAAVPKYYVVSGLMEISNRRLALEMMPYKDININRSVYRIMLVSSVFGTKQLQIMSMMQKSETLPRY